MGSLDGTPLVSVILAAFNAEPYLEQTCRSVLAQTHTALELIAVDDGSTDGTGDLLSAIAASDSRVRIFRQQNLGVAAARNRGIAAATGDFIAPIDADDLWVPTKIERQVRRLSEAGTDTALAYCWWAWIDEAGNVLDRSPRWRIEGRTLSELVQINFMGSASVPLFRRSVIDEVGGYSVKLKELKSQGCEGWDLALRVAARYAVAVVPAVLVGYRRHTRNMSTDCDTMWRSQQLVMTGLLSREPTLSPAVVQQSSGQFALHLAGVAFWSRRYAEACRWALRARPMTLWLAVMPHVARLLARRVLRREGVRAPFSDGRDSIDDSKLPEPLIPYDRIYARHWQSHS